MNAEESKNNWVNWLNDKNDILCEICEEFNVIEPREGFLVCGACSGLLVAVNMRLEFFHRTGRLPEVETNNIPLDELASEEWF